MRSLYLDTSVALLAVLERPVLEVREWLGEQKASGALVASWKLLQVEWASVLRSEGQDPHRARFVLQRCELLSLSDAVLQFAAGLEMHRELTGRYPSCDGCDAACACGDGDSGQALE